MFSIACASRHFQCYIGHMCTVKPHLSGPHLCELFTYSETCLETNCDYIHRKLFTYPDNQSENRGVRISEVSLCMNIEMNHEICMSCTLFTWLDLFGLKIESNISETTTKTDDVPMDVWTHSLFGNPL